MKDLLTSAVDAHGGLPRWREIEAFRLNHARRTTMSEFVKEVNQLDFDQVVLT
jgi:hypothetical protein